MEALLPYALFAALVLTMLAVTVRLRADTPPRSAPARPPGVERKAPP